MTSAITFVNSWSEKLIENSYNNWYDWIHALHKSSEISTCGNSGCMGVSAGAFTGSKTVFSPLLPVKQLKKNS